MIQKYITIILAVISFCFLIYGFFNVKAIMKKETFSCEELKTIIIILMVYMIIMYLTLMIVCIL